MVSDDKEKVARLRETQLRNCELDTMSQNSSNIKLKD